jgi:predicted small secreted protein
LKLVRKARRMMGRLLIAFLLAACLALPLAACTHSGVGDYKYASDSVFGTQYDPGDTWAIYWYICGGDIESGYGKTGDRYGAATDNFNEMLGASLPENNTVVIEVVGGTKTGGRLILTS